MEAELSQSERIAIDRYKKYQQEYLPNVRNLEGLYAPNFDIGIEIGDKFDALKSYIDTLRTYTLHITKAASLRQEHFEKYVLGKKEEEPRHKAWREGMNAIAADCKSKLEYWSAALDAEFDKLCEMSIAPTIDLTAKNYEYSYIEPAKKRKIVMPPKMSERERAKLRAKYRKQFIEKNRMEHALLDGELAKNKTYNDLMAEYEKFRVNNAIPLPASDIRDELLRIGADNLSTCKVVEINIPNGVFVVGTAEEIMDLAVIFYDGIMSAQLYLCKLHKCTVGHNCNVMGKIADADIERLALKVDKLLDLFQFAFQSQDTVAVGYSTIINLLILNYQANWESFVMHSFMTFFVSAMDDASYISNVLHARSKIESIKDAVRKISALSNIRPDRKRDLINAEIFHAVRLKQYLAVLNTMYPGALYIDRIKMMLRMMADGMTSYCAVLKRNNQNFIDPPSVNYVRINRELGIKLKLPENILAEYKTVRKRFDKQYEKELSSFAKDQ